MDSCKAAAAVALQLSMEAGDQLYTIMALTYEDYLQSITASYIPNARDRVENHLKISRQSKQKPMIQLHSMTYQFMHHLCHISPDPIRLSGDYFDEDTVIPEWIDMNNEGGLAHYYVIKIVLSYVANRNTEAEHYLVEAKKYQQAVKTMIVGQLITHLECLVRLSLYSVQSKTDKLKTVIRVKKLLKTIHKWACFQSVNQLPFINLIEAELSANLGHHENAQLFYEKAIDGFILLPSPMFHCASLIRAGLYYDEKGLTRGADRFFSEAKQVFLKTGMTLFGSYYDTQRSISSPDNYNAIRSAPSEPVSQPISEKFLDMASIVKSAQALSGEIVLDRLIKTIMTISLESAGAQKGFLILMNNRELIVEAEGSIDPDKAQTFHPFPVENSGRLAARVVNFVARTQSAVVLSHACWEGDFITDPYIERYGVKSLIAAPMTTSGKLKGIIYLENNLAPHVFSREQTDILEVLASQAAISLENARLFSEVKTAERNLKQFNSELEKRVEERTVELKNAYEQIKIMAHTDPLTGLANRRMMIDRIRQEVLRFKRSNRPFSLVLGDIDHFKSINDTYGHDCGDYTLTTLGRLFVSILREEDIISRWGGEEFMFLLKETDRSGAITAMEKIRKTVSEHIFTFDGQDFSLSMTFGISQYDDKEKDIEHYIRKADQSLYQGKQSGRNTIVLSS
jgi:diguanylate cyclase (GGDEF)-like protein